MQKPVHRFCLIHTIEQAEGAAEMISSGADEVANFVATTQLTRLNDYRGQSQTDRPPTMYSRRSISLPRGRKIG